MKIVKTILIDIVIGVWFIVALFATICLLSYNKFATTVIGKNTFLIIDSDEMEPDYKVLESRDGGIYAVKAGSETIDIISPYVTIGTVKVKVVK